MNTMGEKAFCINCRQTVDYKKKKEIRSRIVRGKEYEYEIFVPYCEKCGEEIILPGMMDFENSVFDRAYRKEEKLVSKEDITKLMNLYGIGMGPLSLALGFGEITITRYLSGQMPSKNYSNIIVKALTDPAFMIKKLEDNKEKITETAYEKAKNKAEEFRKSTSEISKKMKFSIAYFFEILEDITPLTLQKLLFFSQGLSLAVNNKSLFDDTCEGWTHGPVYPPVYRLFKGFGYNTIDESKFCFFSMAENELDEDEKKIIRSVANTFGKYGGKTLERITHNEKPWKDARVGLSPEEWGNRTIDNESVKAFFKSLNENYELSNEAGIEMYINNELMIK